MPGLALVGKTALAAAMLAGGGWLALATGPQDPAPIAAAPADRHAGDLDELLIPVAGVRREALTDTFADAREQGRRHDAIDITAPLGAPVRAAAAGTVEKLFVSRAGGNTVYVRSPSGRYLLYYAHLDRYAPGLHETQRLERGDAIGRAGHSGNADPAAPHLHFAILRAGPGVTWWQAGPAINPYPLLR